MSPIDSGYFYWYESNRFRVYITLVIDSGYIVIYLLLETFKRRFKCFERVF